MRRIRFALVLGFCCRLSALAADTKPVTVDQIYRQQQATQPPQGIAWSPDGTRLSYIADNGDLLAIEGGNGHHARAGRPRQDAGAESAHHFRA